MLLFSFIFCLLVVLTRCQQNPTISFITKERIVNIGDTIDLSCSVQYARDYPVIWAKINKDNPVNNLFISKGSSLSIPDNRYSIRHDDASSTYTLQISKIQEIDAGHYQCQVVIGTSSRVTAGMSQSLFQFWKYRQNYNYFNCFSNRCQRFRTNPSSD